MNHSILIVEDDKDMVQLLENALIQSRYTVRSTSKGSRLLAMLDEQEPDLILLDLVLPDVKGESLCAQVRKDYPHIPIIMITSKDSARDKVDGLTIGADDYVTKPFVMDELLARIAARLRRHGDGKEVITVDDLTIDIKKVEVKRAGKLISLTPHEFKLLEYLARNQGTVMSRDMILNRVWSYSLEVESRVVDVYMGYLRKKIDHGAKKKLVQSVRGFGYTLKA